MRKIQKMKQAVKDMRQQLEEEKQRNTYKFSRLTLPELKTVETLINKIGEGNDMSALEYEELGELEELLKKASDPNAPDVVDHHRNKDGSIREDCKHLYDEEEAPHDF